MTISAVLASLYWLLILLPKINLNSFAGQSAGVRIDDVIIAITAPLLIYLVYRSKARVPPLRALFVFICLAFATTLFNVIVHDNGSVLYPLRFIEYAFFIFAGVLAARENIKLDKLLFIMLFANYALMALQFIGVVGGFASEGYSADVSQRPIGLTGGPWEVGVLIVFATSYFMLTIEQKWKKYAILSVSMVFLLLTGSRMSILSMVIIMALIFVKSLKGLKIHHIFWAGLTAVILFSVIVLVDSPLTQRSMGLFKLENIELFQETLGVSAPVDSFQGFEEATANEDDGDLSWLMRIAKWSLSISMFFSSLIAVLCGLGHGIWGPALDGGWLRLLTEGGIIGLVAFLFAIKAVTTTTVSRFCMIALYINMLMIDIYLSYKTMAMFYFIVGYMHYLKFGHASIRRDQEAAHAQ